MRSHAFAYLYSPLPSNIHTLTTFVSDLPLRSLGTERGRTQVTLGVRLSRVLDFPCLVLDIILDVPRRILGFTHGRLGAVLGVVESGRERRTERGGGGAGCGRTSFGRSLGLREDLGAWQGVGVEGDVALGQARSIP